MTNRETSAKSVTVQDVSSQPNANIRPKSYDNRNLQESKVQFASSNNFYRTVIENKEISKLVTQLTTCIVLIKKVL